MRQWTDVIKWKPFPRYWPFVRGIHRSTVDFPHKDQWRGALMYSLICTWINVWANIRDTGDFRRHCAHYDATIMPMLTFRYCWLHPYGQASLKFISKFKHFVTKTTTTTTTTTKPPPPKKKEKKKKTALENVVCTWLPFVQVSMW